MQSDGYPEPGNKDTKFLAYEWTYKSLSAKGYAPYTPALKDMVDCAVFQVEEWVKEFGVFLADTATDFTKNPKYEKVPYYVIADILHKERHVNVQANFLEKGIKPILREAMKKSNYNVSTINLTCDTLAFKSTVIEKPH
eukprot:6010415-Ditylum_brightwellii.AAC.1